MKSVIRFFSSCILGITLLASLTSCEKPLGPQTRLYMGTVCSLNLFDKGTSGLYENMFTRLQEIEQTFSVNIPTSYISLINANAGKKTVSVPQEVILVLQEALRIAKKTDGAFDPTIGPLVALWGIGSDHPKVPSQEEISRVLPLIDYSKVIIDTQYNTVFLEKEGMALDLGGIVKGYAADQLTLIAQEHGVKQAIIDLGGNIYAYGTKTGSPWNIGIKNPRDPAGTPIIKLQTENKSIVTSGAYERFFEQDGVRYHHILNPKTGYPQENEVISSTIISESSMLADALSTSSYILGCIQGLTLIESEKAEGIMIREDNQVFATPAVVPTLTILNPEFSLQQNILP